MLRIEFQLEVTGILGRFASVDGVEHLELDNILPVDGDQHLLFVTGTFTSDEVSESAFDVPGVQPVAVQPAPTERHAYHALVLLDSDQPSVLTTLTTHEAVPHRLAAEDSQLEVLASVRDWSHLKQVGTAIEDDHGPFELVGTTQTDTLALGLGTGKLKQGIVGKMSDSQVEVLETAYHMGYFKVPQEVTCQDIAQELGISRSTLSERLRRAENNLCELLFGPEGR